MTKISDLGLPPGTEKKLHPIDTVTGLLAVGPLALAREWKVTEKQWAKINERLRAHGKPTLGDFPVREPQRAADSLHRRCRVLLDEEDKESFCRRGSMPKKQKCEWHWLLEQPIATQVEAANQRRAHAEAAEGFEYRARVPEAEWPEGERWCSGCQAFVPLFFCRGSRCYAHASEAAHASMVKRVYEFTKEDYDNLLAWQKGRCYICRRLPRSKRLAIDHDHRTNAVRGLLCASDEWGCNHTLRMVLNSVGMAERLLEYVQRAPAERMLAGEPSPFEQRPTTPRAATAFAGFLDD